MPCTHCQGCRRKTRNQSSWSCNVNKFARQHGLQHKTASGKTVSAKKLGPTCKDCQLKCHEKFTRQQRQNFFDEYYSLNAQAQRVKLLSHRSVITPKRPSGKEPSRKPNFVWHIHGKRVCYTWMCNTFRVGRKFLRKLKVDDGRGA